jgi:hypothetical protein
VRSKILGYNSVHTLYRNVSWYNPNKSQTLHLVIALSQTSLSLLWFFRPKTTLSVW